MPRILSGDWCLVAYVEVSEVALQSGRIHAGIDRPLIVRRGAQLPFITQDQASQAGAFS
jgi:acyl-homoserine lactone synthase